MAYPYKRASHSDPQVAVGVLETIASMCRLLRHMDLSDEAVQEALTQYAIDKDVEYITSLSQIFIPHSDAS